MQGVSFAMKYLMTVFLFVYVLFMIGFAFYAVDLISMCEQIPFDQLRADCEIAKDEKKGTSSVMLVGAGAIIILISAFHESSQYSSSEKKKESEL